MKKLFLFVIGILLATQSFSINKFLVAGGTGNWNSTTNWSLISGGVSGAAFPTSADAVFIDAGSANANLTVNTSSACASISFVNGHTGTFTISSGLAVGGSVTLGSGMTITGTATMTVNATGTLTSNGKTWTGGLTFTGTAQTYTFADNWTVTGTVTLQGSTSTTINGSTLSCASSLVSNSTITSGTTNFVMTGTGTISCAFSSRTLNNNLQINTAGTITMGTTLPFIYGVGTFLYTAGTLVNTGSVLAISSSCTFNMSGITWPAITFQTNTPIVFTLGSPLLVTTLTVTSVSVTFAGAHNATIGSLVYTNGNSLRQITFVAGQTYTITTSISVTGNYIVTNAQKFVSSSPGSTYNLILTSGITQDNMFLDVTDAVSSGGATGWTYKGTLSNTTNWNVLPTQPQTITTAN